MFWKKKKAAIIEETGSSFQNGQPEGPQIKVVIKTDLGNIRTNNEDSASSFSIAGKNSQHKGCLLVVADGMGGHLAGEVASRMAVETIGEEYFKQAGSPPEKALSKAFVAANKKIFDLASGNEQYRGMGTTCTVVAIIGQTVYYAHAGDSRAYLLKNKQITRVTEDHTYVQQLVNSGDITAAEADTHPQRNILTNAMGTKPELRVDTGKCSDLFEENDRLFLCSDGLYDYMDDKEIADVLANQSLQDAADYFIATAKKRGGTDNITVVLAEAVTVATEQNIKSTRDADLPKLTRDADLPANTINL